jgi:hypothetical protein
MRHHEWIRLVLCGFVAGVVWHLLSVVSLSALAPDFILSVQRNAPHPARGGAFFFAVDAAMGIWAVWLYSAIAPRYGAGSTTVVTVGVAWWVVKTLQSAKWAGLGFVALGVNLLPLGALTLGATTLAGAVGAWLYRKADESSPQGAPAT